MKVVIPVAGLGSRLKPHTFTTPKPLMNVAGKTILKYIVDEVLTLNPTEIVFVVGYKKKSIRDFIEKEYPQLNCTFAYQKVRDGDGSAIRLALEHVNEDEELFIIFGDTLIDFDLAKILQENKGVDSLVFGMEVDEPQHYGIMNIKDNLDIYEVEEKPDEPKSNLAIIGSYYFKSILNVKQILNEFYQNKITIKGEYKIVQVIERYIEIKNASIKAAKVNKWFDCGRVEVLLAANRYFLEKNTKNEVAYLENSVVIPPSFVSKNAIISGSVIGPYASIGDGVVITNSIISDTIVDNKSKIENTFLKESLIAKEVVLHGKPSKLSVGERCEIYLK